MPANYSKIRATPPDGVRAPSRFGAGDSRKFMAKTEARLDFEKAMPGPPPPKLPCIIEYVIEIDIPGRGILQVQHLVTDVNGTLAVDGRLIDGVARQISLLKDRLNLHLLTADTHDRQAVIDRQLNLTAVRIQRGNEGAQKADYVRQLGSESVVAIGQGANDAAMLKEAALGICVLSQEGLAAETLLCADLLMPDIATALELLNKPLRLAASLRK